MHLSCTCRSSRWIAMDHGCLGGCWWLLFPQIPIKSPLILILTTWMDSLPINPPMYLCDVDHSAETGSSHRITCKFHTERPRSRSARSIQVVKQQCYSPLPTPCPWGVTISGHQYLGSLPLTVKRRFSETKDKNHPRIARLESTKILSTWAGLWFLTAAANAEMFKQRKRARQLEACEKLTFQPKLNLE